MQSKPFKSDSLKSNLNLNLVNLDSNAIHNELSIHSEFLNDSSVYDSLSISYIAPDSVILFGFKPEWSQFRNEYVPQFDYQKHLIQPLPYDSLYTVLKGVEVVFPGKKLTRNNPDWLIGLLVISFLLLATVKLIFNKYLSQLMQSTVNYSTFSRMFRERYFNFFHASFRLDLIFNLIMALFGYQFLKVYNINPGVKNPFYFYLFCLGIVVGYFTIKRILYFLIGILTENRDEVQEYLFSITVYNRVLGIFLLPLTTIIAFMPVNQVEPILFSGLLLIVIFYLMSLIRGGKIFLKKQFSISYLILYLCTLEFLPILLIYNLLLI